MRVYKKTIYILLFIMILSVAGIFFINYRLNIGSVFPLTERNTTNVLGIIENLMYGIFTGAFISLIISIVGYLNEKQKLYIDIYQALNTAYSNFLVILNSTHKSKYDNCNEMIYFAEFDNKLQILYKNEDLLANAIDNFKFNIDNIFNVPLLKKFTKSKDHLTVMQTYTICMNIIDCSNKAVFINEAFTNYKQAIKDKDEQLQRNISHSIIKIINDTQVETPFLLAKINFYMNEISKIHNINFGWKKTKVVITDEQHTRFYKEIAKAEDEFMKNSMS